jgi:DNA-directed RNA polymerase specialized sigma24 family protein
VKANVLIVTDRRTKLERRLMTVTWDHEAKQPLGRIEAELEPPVVPTEALVPDTHAVPPDRIAAEKDMLSQLQQDMKNWPRPEREVFELYFVEGLEPEEISVLTGQSLKTVRANIASIQSRLRQQMLAREAIA